MAVTKSEPDGKQHPSNHYLVVEDPAHPSTWHLRYKDGDGNIDPRLLGACHAALTVGYRGNLYEGPGKEEALAKLRAIYKQQGMDWPEDSKQNSEPLDGDYTMVDVWALAEFGSDEARESLLKVAQAFQDIDEFHADRPDGMALNPPEQMNTAKAMIGHLLKRVKAHFQKTPVMTQEDFATHYRAAISSAGGKAKAAKTAGEMDDQDRESAYETLAASETSPITSDTGEQFRVFLPMELAEAPEWIPYLPKPGTFKHPRYGTIDLTPQRNADFVGKFKQGVYQSQIPIDAEHQTKLSGAMGWVRDMRQNQDGSVDAKVDWTERGRSMLSDNRYRYVSPEFFDRWQPPHGDAEITNVAIGGALTTRPFFKESSLRPLIASEAGIQVPDEDKQPVPSGTVAPSPRNYRMGGSALLNQFTVNTLSTDSTEENHHMAEEQTPGPDETAQKFAEYDNQIKALTEERDAARAEADGMKQAHEDVSKTATHLSERLQVLEDERYTKQLTERAQNWVGDTAKHVAILRKLDDEGQQTYGETQDALSEQLRTSKLFSAIGSTGSEAEDTAQGQIEALTTKLMGEKPDLSHAQAYAKVLEAHPELYRRTLTETPRA